MDERRCLDVEYTHRRSDRYTGAASEKKGETEYTEFLSQWMSGDVLTESTHAEGQTDTQGLHQRRKKRQNTQFLSQRKSGDVLMESTHAEGQTDTQGLYQRRKERPRVGNLYSIRAWIDSQCNKPAVWKNPHNRQPK